MKGQTSIILAIIFALIVAIFAVINVDSVPVNFFFATREAPLILVILISVLMGSIITAAFGLVKILQLQRQIRQMKKEMNLQQDTPAEQIQEGEDIQEETDDNQNEEQEPSK
ncbi:LapA family protein [Salinibacillus xinjiangensis]|uniref:DUF1049 domain-containing protein n=1 Tax=Salinibacillus xinjiangensis TaxID=1229268 RepID=A0A6G1XBG8_9BACI|nr:lipopolysaccharide assembly protein LapA domain-containing protein [Salinibacillus xinjiangensis]MRG88255.1 DUF1049 domain-containing protein [Salinibacillus xinjiangensis]